MEKPVSISVKDWIIRRMSVQMMLGENVIRKVVDHQFTTAYDALVSCNSLEFSGFGKLYFNMRRAEKRMEKFLSQKAYFEGIINDEKVSDEKRASTQLKLETTMNNIKALKPKLQ